MDSPFHQHLGTNYVPSTSEIRDINNFLEGSVTELRHIGAEIDQLEQRLTFLQEKQTNLSNFIEEHRALTTSARRLGPDVLQEIFLACLADDRNPVMSATEAPVLLTHVCSSWRNVAHSVPRLWAAIHIVLPTMHLSPCLPESLITSYLSFLRRKLDQRHAAIKEWLDRSSACPLSLSIYQRPEGSVGSPPIAIRMQEDYIAFLKNCVIPYSTRWQDVDAYLTPKVMHGLMVRQGEPTGNMHMLKQLHVTCHGLGSTSPDDGNPNLQWKDITPLLQHNLVSATFSGFGVYHPDIKSFTPGLIAWEMLTDLNMDMNTIDSVTPELTQVEFAYTVLRHCQSLQKLKLGLYYHWHRRFPTSTNDQLSEGNIILANLTTFSFKTPVTTQVTSFIRKLHLPSLEVLDVQVYDEINTDSAAHELINMLLLNCGDKIHTLGMYLPTALRSVDEMVQVLRLIPNLLSLKILSKRLTNNRWEKNSWFSPWYDSGPWTTVRFINDDLLHALTPSGYNYSDIVCPQLEALELIAGKNIGVTAAGLKQFIKARKQARHLDDRVAPLRQLRVYLDEYKLDDDPGEKVSLDGDSAVYFRKNTGIESSPWDGLDFRTEQPTTIFSDLSSDIYTEL